VSSVVQYLNEALAMEHALVRVLQSQIAMTPRGSNRDGLEKHLGETRNHADRVGRRLEALGDRSNPLMAVVGLAENVVGQALAFGKTPFDLLRGSGGEEKVLKNAKDACATEALEIATYTAIERLARSADDAQTATLAASIRADEERMLQRILREIPKLTDAVVGADVEGRPSYDVTKTARPTPLARPARRPRRPLARPRPRPSGPPAKRARSRASHRLRVRPRAPSPPRATWRSRATTASPPRRSPAASPASPRSTSPRSIPTSDATRTARPF
jgi:ferritin-like metal-binding protein YciE